LKDDHPGQGKILDAKLLSTFEITIDNSPL
jgi:hypothetical protein